MRVKQELSVDIVASLFWSLDDGICLHYSVLWDDYAYKEHFKETEEMVMNYISVPKFYTEGESVTGSYFFILIIFSLGVLVGFLRKLQYRNTAQDLLSRCLIR